MVKRKLKPVKKIFLFFDELHVEIPERADGFAKRTVGFRTEKLYFFVKKVSVFQLLKIISEYRRVGGVIEMKMRDNDRVRAFGRDYFFKPSYKLT